MRKSIASLMTIMKKPLQAVCLSLLFCMPVLAEAIWIDVRSDAEYEQSHIDGDLHIPHDRIAAEIGAEVEDKNAEIKVYCRSGRRAGLAREALLEAGYSNVSNAGGIDDARKQRGLEE